MIRYLSIITLLYLVSKSSNCIEFPPNPCSSIFDYSYSRGTWYGHITVPSPPFSQFVTIISARFSIIGNIGTYGPIKLDEYDKGLDKIRSGQPLKFVIKFPRSNYLPQVTEIKYDGNDICVGPEVPAPSTSFWLQYTFNWTGSYFPDSYTPIYTYTSPPTTPKLITQEPFVWKPIVKPSFAVSPKPTATVTVTPKTKKYSNYLECGIIRTKRDIQLNIYNGDPTVANSHPWLAALFDVTNRNNAEFFCAGSLISKKHVLTAAHCTFAKSDAIIEVRLGVHNRKNLFDPGSIKRTAEIVIKHPDYVEGNAHADISFIALDREVLFTDAIKPVCLWNYNPNYKSIVGIVGMIMGWGLQENGEQSNIPMKADVSIMEKEKCREAELLRSYITEETFCAGTKGVGPCLGDSGGGLFLLIDGKWYLRGIISTSIADRRTQVCDVNTFSVYVDTAKYLNWIVDNMESH